MQLSFSYRQCLCIHEAVIHHHKPDVYGSICLSLYLSVSLFAYPFIVFYIRFIGIHLAVIIFLSIYPCNDLLPIDSVPVFLTPSLFVISSGIASLISIEWTQVSFTETILTLTVQQCLCIPVSVAHHHLARGPGNGGTPARPRQDVPGS